jgi:hypothetical protein
MKLFYQIEAIFSCTTSVNFLRLLFGF